MAVEKPEVEIFKPRTDTRSYRRIVLPNALEVLLISDPDTDKAAASMDVGVGSFSDPDGLDGLAHFLEHMLFYASEKYPLEDSYSKYITEVYQRSRRRNTDQAALWLDDSCPGFDREEIGYPPLICHREGIRRLDCAE